MGGQPRAPGFTQLLTIPTEDQRRGDFSRYNATIYDPLTGTADGSGRTPFPGNIIPLNRQSSITRKVQDLVPLPNRPGTVGQLLRIRQPAARPRQPRPEDQLESPRHPHGLGQILHHERQRRLRPGARPRLAARLYARAISATASFAHAGCHHRPAPMTFSPTFLWDGAIGWTRQGQEVTGFRYGDSSGGESWGFRAPTATSTDVRESGVPVFEIPGYTRLRQRYRHAALLHATILHLPLQQNFSWNRSRHQPALRLRRRPASPPTTTRRMAAAAAARKGCSIFSQSITRAPRRSRR